MNEPKSGALTGPGRPWPKPRLTSRAVLLAAGALLLLFASYEALERLWLADVLTMGTIHALHLLRGALGVVIVGAILVSSLQRSGSVFVFAARGELEEQVTQLRDRTALERSSVQWLVRMRWLATLTLVVLIVVGTRMIPVLSPERTLPLLAGSGVLALGNLLFTRNSTRSESPRRELRLQIAFDLALFAYFIHQSGGIENPLYVAICFHVVLACILLSSAEGYAVALLASLILSLVTGLELIHVLPHYAVALSPHPHHGGLVIHPAFDVSFDVARVGTAALLFFILAMLTSVLSAQLKSREEQLLSAADEALGLKRRLEGVLDASQAGVGLLDLSGRVAWGNRPYREWVSRRDEEVEQAERPEAAVGEGDGAPRVLRAPAAEAVREARVAHAEASFTRPDGQLQHVLVSAAPIVGEDGKVAQIVEVVHDVSRLKEAQAQLVLAGKLAALGELAGRIAHEINNPVGIIQAKLELLLDDDLPPHVREELSKMLDLGRRATTTARSLLSLVRPSEGARVSTDLCPLVRRSLDLVDGLFRGHGIALELDVRDGLRPVRCNEDAINQVLLNLLTNAAQAMPDGGRLQVTLMPVAREGRRLVAIVVADTGPGIPPAARPHLFEPFFTTKPAGVGTGLGLAISMGIVRDHGGTIEVDSPAEGGSRFAVLLPEADDESA